MKLPKIPAALRDYGVKLLLYFAAIGVAMLVLRVTGQKVETGPLPLPPLVAEQPTEAMQEPLYFCGRVESVSEPFTAKPWPDKRITWSIDTSKSPLPAEQVREAFRVAYASWAAHLDLEFVWVENEADALVRMRFGDYDGSGKVLAWSELSDGTRTPKHQLYDRAEKWGVFSGNSQGIDLVRVGAHEIGHVLGLLHDEGKGDALMDPIYSRALRFPTDKDVARALKLGYKPKPPTKSDPPAPGPLVITFPVSAKADDVAEALRKAGFRIEPPK